MDAVCRSLKKAEVLLVSGKRGDNANLDFSCGKGSFSKRRRGRRRRDPAQVCIQGGGEDQGSRGFKRGDPALLFPVYQTKRGRRAKKVTALGWARAKGERAGRMSKRIEP